MPFSSASEIKIDINDFRIRRTVLNGRKQKYIIKISGKLVEVTPEVYGEYYRMNRYARYQEERDRLHGKTLYSNLDSNEMLGEELISDQSALSTEDAAIAHILSEKLHRCLEMLPDKARQKILCKSRQAVVKETGANQRISRVGHNPA